MITIETPVDNVLGIRLSGTVEVSDIELMEDAFREKLDTGDRFGLVVDTTDWTDITGDALAEDTKFEFGLLRKLNRFPRMALVSDKEFPKAVAKFFDPLIPTVEIRTFTANESDQAVAFAAEPAEANALGKHAVTMIDTGNPKLVGFEVEGVLTKEDVERVIQPLQHAFESEQQIDLLGRMKNYGGFDPSILISPSVISMKLSSLSHVRRYAVVGAPAWIKNVAGTIASALPIDIRFFDSEDEPEAWAWLKSEYSDPRA